MAKRGRLPDTKKITPSEMWGLFLQYVEDTKANPILKHEFVGKNGDSVERKLERPLTMDGFENFIYRCKLGTRLDHHFGNTNGAYEKYKDVCAQIKRVIRQDQIEGGMAMIYNPSITQRLNGLVEKTENKHEVSEIIIKHES
jgi:hypothetical protein